MGFSCAGFHTGGDGYHASMCSNRGSKTRFDPKRSHSGGILRRCCGGWGLLNPEKCAVVARLSASFRGMVLRTSEGSSTTFIKRQNQKWVASRHTSSHRLLPAASCRSGFHPDSLNVQPLVLSIPDARSESLNSGKCAILSY